MNETPLPLIVRAIECLRTIADAAERGERGPELAEVVAVAAATCQPKAAEALVELAERDDLVRRLVGLQLVAVDDDREPVQPRPGRPPGALRSSDPPAARRHRPSRRHVRRARAGASPTRSRDPSRSPCRASRSSPRYRERRRPDARRARRAGAASGNARAGSRRARTAPRRGRARRDPSRRSRRRDSGRPSRRAAVFSSSKRRNATTSIALKVEPRCPDPARLTATSAFRRHMSREQSRAARRTGCPRRARGRARLLARGQVRHEPVTVPPRISRWIQESCATGFGASTSSGYPCRGDESLLDVGCGDGGVGRLLRRRFGAVSAVDIEGVAALVPEQGPPSKLAPSRAIWRW